MQPGPTTARVVAFPTLVTASRKKSFTPKLIDDVSATFIPPCVGGNDTPCPVDFGAPAAMEWASFASPERSLQTSTGVPAAGSVDGSSHKATVAPLFCG